MKENKEDPIDIQEETGPISVDILKVPVGIEQDLQLSQSSVQLLNSFRQQIYQLKYPRLLSQTNIILRSIMQFFYEYQPDKVLSLKLQNITYEHKTDIFVISIQQDVTDANNINMAHLLPNNPLFQDQMSKQLVSVYELVNMQNKHVYVKDPFTLNTYVYSNGYLVSILNILPSHINFYIRNNFSINILNVMYNLRLVQDITKFGLPYIQKIIEFLTAVQVPQSNLYNKVSTLNDSDKKYLKAFIGDSNRFSVSRYNIGQYKILFTDMDNIEIFDYMKKQKQTGESTSQITQIIFNESSIIDMKYKVYTALYENIVITNITTTMNTLKYTAIDKLIYQFDVNSIYFIMFLTYISKRDIGLDVRQISPLIFIDMLQNIEYPSKDNMIIQRKKAIPTILKKTKQISNQR